ncbi:PTS sugar transporter subunit IIB [Streptococcus porcinus]|uniref:PTS sugar transporter subunit IIB n=2 Tax=Streptococcus porcinus TaxID=1340 RepID=A0A4V0H0W0_STRPO|nr:PTS sugar transporter subunit IIB [Streptococcus porcinus]EGJ26771.1 PTS system protein, Lactose/Cellobiose specific IIB subunit [Streptococcus porcinus str. Jelinkova 176]MBA2795474.1 PTS sugar transporter subunit IIB [Streptococcus porcinus]SQG43184.1 Putative PTS system galactitol-specific enzyme IIB component [Streptococcus porcinus]VTS19202.1 Putative PTS system galactitol-specific enzyme IIB component [Streptococcus porcinus]VTT42232.1 Putative PTS system galactitol-specific enzyme II
MKRIIVACGSGVATSQTVASKVGRLLKEAGVACEIEAVDMKSLDQFLKNADAYISIVKPKKDYGIPVFNGVAFLTGIGQKKELDNIIAFINQ